MGWASVIGAALGGIGQHQTNQANTHGSRYGMKKGLLHLLRQASHAQAYGIHPLAALGASPNTGPVVPMQNPLGPLSAALANQQIDPDTGINRELKEYALREAKRREADAKWEYSILIPVSHPHLPEGKKLWAFNSKYAMYGLTAQTMVVAANSKEAMSLIFKGATPQQQKYLQELQNQKKRKKLKKHKQEWRPGGGMDMGIGGM